MISVTNLISTSFLYLISFIFSTLIFLLCLLYRMITTVLIKVQYPEAVFLGSQDSGLALPESTDEKQLLYSVLCNGTVDIELFRSILWDSVKRNPRLWCYVEEKYGYYFWLKEKDFNIEDHIFYHPDLSISTKRQWKEVQNNLYYNTPVPKGFSPWVIHFVPLNPDYEESQEQPSFFLVISFYHCLCDGYSGLYNFLSGISDYDEPRIMVSNIPTPTFGQEILMFLQSIFLLPYFVQEFFYKRSLFHQFVRTGRQVYSNSGHLKTEAVKTVKQATRVPFFVVLLSCMMGAVQKFLQKSNRKLPSEITVAIPQVLWKREDKVELKNNFVLVYFTLPFNEKVGIDRLKKITSILKGPYTRNKNIAAYVGSKTFFVLPNFISKFFYTNEQNSVLLSVAGVERYPRSILRQRKIQTEPAERMLSLLGNIGFIFHPITFGDNISLSAHSWSSIATEEELDQMLKDFEEELRLMIKDIS